MRIDISYKFILGFIAVVATIVAVDLVVPYLELPEYLTQLVVMGTGAQPGVPGDGLVGEVHEFPRVDEENHGAAEAG